MWEANHVWLIFVFVLLWTCFPEAYASIMLTLFVPLTLAALGIVLRGASFAFRKVVIRTRDQRNFGAAFAISSVLVPYCLGAVVGAIASGRVPAGGESPVTPGPAGSTRPRSSAACSRSALSAYLAAFFLVSDAGRLSDDAMVDLLPASRLGGRRSSPAWSRSPGSSCCHNDATYLFDGLKSRALPLVILSAVFGVGALAAPHCVRHRRGARFAAVVAVGSVVVAWGVAQWDYLLPTSLTVSQAAAPVGHDDGRLRRHRPRRRC